MTKKIIAAVLLLFSVSAFAQDIQSLVQTELAKIALQQDMRETVLSTNRLIKLVKSRSMP
jgi:hypothetical protein